jgi:hypothetical protein
MNANSKDGFVVLKLRRVAWLWPGFTRLWYRGEPVSLIVAVLYALLLNAALLGSFVWTELTSVGARVLLWTATGLCLIVAATYSFIRDRGKVALREAARALLLRAQREYLRGDWIEAESLVRQILKSQADDIEARLFLATILRHTKRPSDAKDQLRRLSKMVGSAEWCMEIDHEWRQLRRTSTTLPSDPPEETETTNRDAHAA